MLPQEEIERIQKTMVVSANYQKQILDTFNFFKEKRGTYIDVGACIGGLAYPFIDLFNKVVCFEPNPYAFNAIPDAENLEKHNCALGEENGESEIVVPNGIENPHHGSMVRFGENGTWTKKETMDSQKKVPDDPTNHIGFKTEIKVLDEFNFQDVDLIKVDVEGYEGKVLRGAKNTILRCEPLIICECKRDDQMDAFEFLVELNSIKPYKIQRIGGKNVIAISGRFFGV